MSACGPPTRNLPVPLTVNFVVVVDQVAEHGAGHYFDDLLFGLFRHELAVGSYDVRRVLEASTT